MGSPDDAKAIPIRAPISSTDSAREAYTEDEGFWLDTRGKDVPIIGGTSATSIRGVRANIPGEYANKHVLAPETNPNEMENRIYPVSVLTAERQKILTLKMNANTMLILITPSLGQSNGTNVRPKTEDPLMIDSYEIIRIRGKKEPVSCIKLT